VGRIIIVMLLWSEIMGGYNTPDAMVEIGGFMRVKVGHEITTEKGVNSVMGRCVNDCGVLSTPAAPLKAGTHYPCSRPVNMVSVYGNWTTRGCRRL